MKKLILTLLFFPFVATLTAQELPDEKYLKEFREYIEHIGVKKSLTVSFDFPDDPAQRAIMPVETVKAMERIEIAAERLLDKFLETEVPLIYFINVPYEIIVELNQFYRSPAGKFHLQNNQRINLEIQQKMQESFMPALEKEIHKIQSEIETEIMEGEVVNV